ncbi:MAG: esterase [Proteobacteria bacterium]|nr:MAG: esterase [Pseudomonadota bacterium]
MNTCTFQRIADLDNLVRSSPNNKRCIVLLHGYGANFSDLTGISAVLDPQQSWDWYFPNGTLEISFAPEYVGRAWFPIDMQRLEQALMRGERQPFRDELPAGFTAASLSVDRMVRELSDRYDQIVIGGFSQGSMISCDLALHSEAKISALLLLSSNIIAASRWKTAIDRKPRAFKVFQSHGQFDNVLPIDGALELSRFWKDHNYAHEYVSFPGGHEIPYPVLNNLKSFLEGL